MKQSENYRGVHEKKFILESHEDRVIVQVGNVIIDVGVSNPDNDQALIDIYGYSRDKENKGVLTIGKGTEVKRIFLESEKL